VILIPFPLCFRQLQFALAIVFHLFPQGILMQLALIRFR